MRLLLDQGLPRSTVVYLQNYGIEAVHVGDQGLATASDSEILNLGRQESMVVVTLDADFHTLLALSGLTGPSVIRIRIEGLRGEALASTCSDKGNIVPMASCSISVAGHHISSGFDGDAGTHIDLVRSAAPCNVQSHSRYLHASKIPSFDIEGWSWKVADTNEPTCKNSAVQEWGATTSYSAGNQVCDPPYIYTAVNSGYSGTDSPFTQTTSLSWYNAGPTPPATVTGALAIEQSLQPDTSCQIRL